MELKSGHGSPANVLESRANTPFFAVKRDVTGVITWVGKWAGTGTRGGPQGVWLWGGCREDRELFVV